MNTELRKFNSTSDARLQIRKRGLNECEIVLDRQAPAQSIITRQYKGSRAGLKDTR